MSAFQVHIVTLVPTLWETILGADGGLVGRAFTSGKAELTIHNLRDYGKGVHRQVDDNPFGGGAGMVIGVEPLHKAVQTVRESLDGPIYLLSPRGEPFAQPRAHNLAASGGFGLICGRYEGVDERIRDYIDGDLSIGDMVLSGGDPAGWCMVDSVVRLLPGVLGNSESIREESFANNQLEYPHYTRPAEYEGKSVPDVLRSGNHKAIAQWRDQQSLAITRENRPDLLDLSKKEG
jgi:tRNA (guanine37-N1)-methyltransferase